jgi:molybdopterin-guanine dinucleotide biosynthesis protein A
VGGRLANVDGAVLLGGAGTRLGRDKASLPVGGVPAATRVARVLAALCEDVLLVGGTPPDDTPGRRVPDRDGAPRCALRGLVSALAAARAERVLVVATDLPLVTPALLLGLVAWPGADAVAPRVDGVAQPLCALYAREAALACAEARLARGELALQGVLAALSARFVEAGDLRALDPAGTALVNVNTTADWAEVEAIATR